MRAQGFFKVDNTLLGQPTGFIQRLRRDVDSELMASCINADRCHAGTIDGDAVAQAHVIEVVQWRFDGQSLAMV